MVMFGLSGLDAVFSPSVLQSVSDPRAVWEQKLPRRGFPYSWSCERMGSVMWSSDLLMFLFAACQGNHWQPTVPEPATGFWSWEALLLMFLPLCPKSAGFSLVVCAVLDSLRVLWLDLKLKQVTVVCMLSLDRLALFSDGSGTNSCSSCTGPAIGPKSWRNEIYHNIVIFVI